jgi:hypothetical protein
MLDPAIPKYFSRRRRCMPCYAVQCYAMLCYIYVMLCYVMLCYVMLCYVMLCNVMLCYVMLRATNYGRLDSEPSRLHGQDKDITWLAICTEQKIKSLLF